MKLPRRVSYIYKELNTPPAPFQHYPVHGY